jgi:hypothetical protein
MTHLNRFMAYAAAFEQTFVDDDWSRLEPFFTEDVVYRVSGIPAACEIHGRDNVFRGIKKSLDGFDRKMTSRQIIPTKQTTEDGNRVTLQGFVRYERGGTTVDLHAVIVAEFDGDRICNMHDTFTLGTPEMKWLGAKANDLDGSYV